jgi:hypothetical protein
MTFSGRGNVKTPQQQQEDELRTMYQRIKIRQQEFENCYGHDPRNNPNLHDGGIMETIKESAEKSSLKRLERDFPQAEKGYRVMVANGTAMLTVYTYFADQQRLDPRGPYGPPPPGILGLLQDKA